MSETSEICIREQELLCVYYSEVFQGFSLHSLCIGLLKLDPSIVISSV